MDSENSIQIRCTFVPPGATAQLDKAAKQKVVHLVRHGQGTHNLFALTQAKGHRCMCTLGKPGCPYMNDEHLDAHLTQRGRLQAATAGSSLLQTTPAPQMAFVSPMSRTLQTATIALSKCAELNIPLIAEESIRERIGVHPCDKRSAREDIEKLYPGVDFSRIENGPDTIWTEQRETEDTLAARGKTFFLSLLKHPETTFAVFTHSSFLYNTINRSFVTSDPNATKRFETGETRVLVLTYA